MFGDNYHIKVMSDDGNHSVQDYVSFDQTKKNKYDKAVKEFVNSCLIINNSLSTKTHSYFKEQYVVNQSNCPNMVVNVVAMITSFGADDGDEGKKNINKIPLYLYT